MCMRATIINPASLVALLNFGNRMTIFYSVPAVG
jgi:hypothetical protein